MTETVFLKDKDWSVIDGDVCRVKEFRPMARVEDGVVRALDRAMPYAAVDFECTLLSQDATGFITHRLDFLHLWAAFNERGVTDDEEVLFFWTKKNLRRSARLISKAMPKLWVMVCRKGAFELMTEPDFKPELGGQARFEAYRPLAEWKPDVMD